MGIAMGSVTIEDCRWAIATHRKSVEGDRVLEGMLAQGIAERLRVEMKLDIRWSWLNRNPDHELHAEREGDCIEALAEYVKWSDVVHDTCRVLDKADRERCR